MRELHVVGTDADGALLLAEAPDDEASFLLRDPTLPPTGPRGRQVRRAPGPAQIQARLRAGVSPAAIARETGTDLAHVQRWAAPVHAEMSEVLRGALGSHVDDGDRRSAVPLATVVERVTDGTDLEVDWQVTRRADGRWRVLLRLLDGDRVATASWVWDGRGRRLEAASARARALSFGG